MDYKYCYIILHYQNTEDTIASIDSIQNLNSYVSTGIVIIDNASPNGSGKQLQEKYKNIENIKVILNEKNDGFSHANNVAGKWAKENWKPDFYIVANNDIIFHERDFNEKIEKIYSEEYFSVLGPDIYDINKGNHQNPYSTTPLTLQRINQTILLNRIALSTFWISYPLLKEWFKRLNNSISDVEGYSEKHYNPQFMGACLIFSRQYYDERNCFFAPETFFYTEEAILAAWCKANNHKTVYSPELSVQHTGGSATNSEKDMRKRIKFQMKNILSSSIIYRKYLRSISDLHD